MSDLFDLPFEDDDPAEAPTPASPEAPADRGLPTVGPGLSTGDRSLATADSGLSTGDPGLTTADWRLPTARRVLTVTELTLRVRDLLEAEFGEVSVEGELSNCRVWNTGHLYFTLKDGASQVRAVIFRTALRYVPFKPADGLKVVARGKISVYEPKGEYQLICEHMEPQGLGARQLAFDQLKARLQGEGLFESGRKRPLPALPRKIGIVTSLDGAALRDIIKVLRRRYANAHLVIAPARVQGEDAAAEISRALRQIGRVGGVDVVIVGRGGGSIEDLWAFNDEGVARAIARSPVPVISAIGHETDYTIADFVADLRAPTPSAAAELVVSAKDEFSRRIDRLNDGLRAATRRAVQNRASRVHQASARPAFAGFHGRIVMRGRHVAEIGNQLARSLDARLVSCDRAVREIERRLSACHPGRRLANFRTRSVDARSRLTAAATARRLRGQAAAQFAAGRLHTLSPLAVLARGYAVCWTADQRVVRAASDVSRGDTVRVTLSHGAIEAKVSKTE